MTAVHDTPTKSVQLPPRALTLDDVASLAAADELHRYELDEGNLLVLSPADAEHASIISRIVVWLVQGGHPPDQVLATPGLEINERSAGRSPDVLVLDKPAPAGTMWISPSHVTLAIEVVSPGSENLDRLVKPGEYARASIPRYWRVERDGEAPTVHMYSLGTDENGRPAYLGHRAILLADLLASRESHF